MDVEAGRMDGFLERMGVRVFDYASCPVIGQNSAPMTPNQPSVWFWSSGTGRLDSVAD
jgi:hypothetical protein